MARSFKKPELSIINKKTDHLNFGQNFFGF